MGWGEADRPLMFFRQRSVMNQEAVMNKEVDGAVVNACSLGTTRLPAYRCRRRLGAGPEAGSTGSLKMSPLY